MSTPRAGERGHRTWRVFVSVGRETPGSRTRHETDEEYFERDYVKVLAFPQAADRIVRAVVKCLLAFGFKPRGTPTLSSRAGPE